MEPLDLNTLTPQLAAVLISMSEQVAFTLLQRNQLVQVAKSAQKPRNDFTDRIRSPPHEDVGDFYAFSGAVCISTIRAAAIESKAPNVA